jgi:hypothetical protein
MMLLKSSMIALAAGLAVSLVCSAAASAQEVPGTWRLLKRELADGSEQRPPAVVGLGTWVGGYPPLVVIEGDTLTATLHGVFVDYWERVK